jgi:long-chain acyl-CoA synthetase
MFEEGNEVVIGFSAVFHIYGQVVVMLGSLVQGTHHGPFTTPDMDDILEAMERYQASAFYGVPTLYEYLKEYEKTDRVNWKRSKCHRLRRGHSARIHHSRDWERRTGTQITGRVRHDRNHGREPHHPPDHPQTGILRRPHPKHDAAIVDVDGTDSCPWARMAN